MKPRIEDQDLPSLGEIQELYEILLRNKAYESPIDKESGSFFKEFRKFDVTEKALIWESKLFKKY